MNPALAVAEVSAAPVVIPFAMVAAGVDPLAEHDVVRPVVRLPEAAPLVVVEARSVGRQPAPAPRAALPTVAPEVLAAQAPPSGAGSLRLSRDEIHALTLEMSGDADWATWATRVIMCESSGHVNAIGPGGYYGLAQVGSFHPYDMSRMLTEPRYAIQAMINIYQSSGPAAWGCK